MALLTGLFMVGTFIAFIALMIHRNKTNLTTFIVALVITLLLASMTGGSTL